MLSSSPPVNNDSNAHNSEPRQPVSQTGDADGVPIANAAENISIPSGFGHHGDGDSSPVDSANARLSDALLARQKGQPSRSGPATATSTSSSSTTAQSSSSSSPFTRRRIVRTLVAVLGVVTISGMIFLSLAGFKDMKTAEDEHAAATFRYDAQISAAPWAPSNSSLASHPSHSSDHVSSSPTSSPTTIISALDDKSSPAPTVADPPPSPTAIVIDKAPIISTVGSFPPPTTIIRIPFESHSSLFAAKCCGSEVSLLMTTPTQYSTNSYTDPIQSSSYYTVRETMRGLYEFPNADENEHQDSERCQDGNKVTAAINDTNRNNTAKQRLLERQIFKWRLPLRPTAEPITLRPALESIDDPETDLLEGDKVEKKDDGDGSKNENEQAADGTPFDRRRQQRRGYHYTPAEINQMNATLSKIPAKDLASLEAAFRRYRKLSDDDVRLGMLRTVRKQRSMNERSKGTEEGAEANATTAFDYSTNSFQADKAPIIIPAYGTACIGLADCADIPRHFAAFGNPRVALGYFILVLNSNKGEHVALAKALHWRFPQQFVYLTRRWYRMPREGKEFNFRSITDRQERAKRLLEVEKEKKGGVNSEATTSASSLPLSSSSTRSEHDLSLMSIRRRPDEDLLGPLTLELPSSFSSSPRTLTLPSNLNLFDYPVLERNAELHQWSRWSAPQKEEKGSRSSQGGQTPVETDDARRRRMLNNSLHDLYHYRAQNSKPSAGIPIMGFGQTFNLILRFVFDHTVHSGGNPFQTTSSKQTKTTTPPPTTTRAHMLPPPFVMLANADYVMTPYGLERYAEHIYDHLAEAMLKDDLDEQPMTRFWKAQRRKAMATTKQTTPTTSLLASDPDDTFKVGPTDQYGVPRPFSTTEEFRVGGGFGLRNAVVMASLPPSKEEAGGEKALENEATRRKLLLEASNGRWSPVPDEEEIAGLGSRPPTAATPTTTGMYFLGASDSHTSPWVAYEPPQLSGVHTSDQRPEAEKEMFSRRFRRPHASMGIFGRRSQQNNNKDKSNSSGSFSTPFGELRSSERTISHPPVVFRWESFSIVVYTYLAWKTLGLFHEERFPAYGEDVDLMKTGEMQGFVIPQIYDDQRMLNFLPPEQQAIAKYSGKRAEQFLFDHFRSKSLKSREVPLMMGRYRRKGQHRQRWSNFDPSQKSSFWSPWNLKQMSAGEIFRNFFGFEWSSMVGNDKLLLTLGSESTAVQLRAAAWDSNFDPPAIATTLYERKAVLCRLFKAIRAHASGQESAINHWGMGMVLGAGDDAAPHGYQTVARQQHREELNDGGAPPECAGVDDLEEARATVKALASALAHVPLSRSAHYVDLRERRCLLAGGGPFDATMATVHKQRRAELCYFDAQLAFRHLRSFPTNDTYADSFGKSYAVKALRDGSAEMKRNIESTKFRKVFEAGRVMTDEGSGRRIRFADEEGRLLSISAFETASPGTQTRGDSP